MGAVSRIFIFIFRICVLSLSVSIECSFCMLNFPVNILFSIFIIRCMNFSALFRVFRLFSVIFRKIQVFFSSTLLRMCLDGRAKAVQAHANCRSSLICRGVCVYIYTVSQTVNLKMSENWYACFSCILGYNVRAAYPVLPRHTPVFLVMYIYPSCKPYLNLRGFCSPTFLREVCISNLYPACRFYVQIKNESGSSLC